MTPEHAELKTRITSPPVAAGGILQRACACGQHTVGGGECEGCKKKATLQRRSANSSSRFAADLTLVPVRQQRALIVSNPGDPMEVEADRMADRVVRSEPLSTPISPVHPSTMQRQADTASADESTSESDEAAEENAESVGEDQLIGDESGRPKLTLEASRRPKEQSIVIPEGPGASLPSNVQTFMEGRFGHDFSQVRVHTDRSAVRSAQDLQAQAYTVGQNIYFNQNHYAPDNPEGRRLLAHELTHVVQQTGGASQSVQRAPDPTPRRRRRAPDSPGGAGQRRKREEKPKPKCAKGDCDGNCAAPVEKAIRHPSCSNETCANGSAASSSNFIRHLDVDLTTQMVTAELGTAAKTLSTRSFLSSPRPGVTPTGMHRIGRKCGPCHTNMHAHGMGWFTGFANDLEFGFHDSQTVAKGVHSLGCVRVAPCSEAKWINENTESGTTTVCVHTGGHCKPKAPKAKGKGKGKGQPGTKQSPGGSPVPSSTSPPAAPPLVSEAEDDMDEIEQPDGVLV